MSFNNESKIDVSKWTKYWKSKLLAHFGQDQVHSGWCVGGLPAHFKSGNSMCALQVPGNQAQMWVLRNKKEWKAKGVVTLLEKVI